jgi:uncharacterized protein YkwD
MKRLACIATALLLAAPLAPAAQLAPPETTVVALVNAERVKAGLKPVVAEPRLARIAAAHAADMARNSFVGHVGSDGAGMIERALRAGYGYAYIAENVAGGQKSAETAMASWMSSGGHRRNILAPEATQMGVGHAIEGGRAPKYGAYWVIVLGAPVAP